MKPFVVSEIKTIARDEDSMSEIAWDYVGNQIAFVRSDSWIWIYDLGRGESYRLIQGRSPEWLPDNEKILFERDGVLYSCPVAEGSKERRVWDGHELGSEVRLQRPRVSRTGTILVQCHNVKDNELHRPAHHFAQAPSETANFEPLPLNCLRSDVVWDREGDRCLIESWVGDNEMRIIGDDWRLEAVFKATLGDFSPNAQKIAAFIFGINAVYLYERQDDTWHQAQNVASPREIVIRNRVHWLTDSLLAFEAGLQLYLLDTSTKEIVPVDVDLANLTRRGLLSISWFPAGTLFVYEAHDGDQVALNLVRLSPE
jgi:hypothetical protein